MPVMTAVFVAMSVLMNCAVRGIFTRGRTLTEGARTGQYGLRFSRNDHFALLAISRTTRLTIWPAGLPLPRVSDRMQYNALNPLIVQGDRTVLVEVDNPKYAEARDAIAPFAELEKSPEHIHTYRLTNLSLWNAAAAGLTAAAMVDVLRRFSKFPLPNNLPPDLT